MNTDKNEIKSKFLSVFICVHLWLIFLGHASQYFFAPAAVSAARFTATSSSFTL
jgi:hypothetical protein